MLVVVPNQIYATMNVESTSKRLLYPSCLSAELLGRLCLIYLFSFIYFYNDAVTKQSTWSCLNSRMQGEATV
jgi:hypothetical protein